MTTTKTKDQLLTELANATKTYYGCSGHNKADMNKMKMIEYKAELTALKIPIPSVDELLSIGVFNGEGSY